MSSIEGGSKFSIGAGSGSGSQISFRNLFKSLFVKRGSPVSGLIGISGSQKRSSTISPKSL